MKVREYTLEELKNMTLRELCQIAAFLGILTLEKLVADIWNYEEAE